MTVGSNNPFPSVLAVEQGSTPATPASGNQRLFIRTSDHLLCYVNSSGTVTQVGGGLVNPMTTKGDVILGDTSGTPSRLAAGTSTYVLTSNGAAAFPSWQAAAGGLSPLLALHAYAPSSIQVYTSGTGSMADVDATNMVVTFTAPASTNVLVRLSAWGDCTTITTDAFWGLREATTNLNVTTRVLRGSNPIDQAYVSATMYLAGISAGSHTYKWSYGTHNNGADTTRIIIQDGAGIDKWGPGVMEVWAAP